MANVYPFTNNLTWTGTTWYDLDSNTPLGRLPDSGDDVYLNGRTVNINTNISINKLSHFLADGVNSSGGQLNISTGGYTLNINTIRPNSLATNTNIMAVNHTTGGNTTINATTIGGVLNSNYGIQLAVGNGNSAVINVQNIYTNTGTTSSGGGAMLFINSAGQTTVNILSNNWYPASTLGNYCIIVADNYTSSNCTINCANINSNTLGTQKDIFLNCNTLGTCTINGNVYGNDILGGNGIKMNLAASSVNATNKVTINGNVYAGANGNAVYLQTLRLEILGTAYAHQTIAGYYAVNMPNAGNKLYLNNVTAGITNAIYTIYDNEIVVKGNLTCVNGMQPIYAKRWKLDPTTTATYTFQKENNTDLILNNTNTDAGQPSENDVRKNVVFGSSNQFSGKCYVPNKSYVSAGVLVDVNDVGAFTGGSSITPKDIWDYMLNADPTLTGSVKERFLNQATIDSTGQQIQNLI